MIDNKLIKERRWRDFLLKMENGEEAMFRVKDIGQIYSIRTVAGRINTQADRTFRISVRANRETKTVYIQTGIKV